MTIWLIDTTAFLHRAMHAIYRDRAPLIPENDTQFLRHAAIMVAGLLDRVRAEHVIFALDSTEPSLRVDMFPDYKKSRKAHAPVLAAGAPRFYDGLCAAGFLVMGWDRHEADDVIASLVLASVNAPQVTPIKIVSADKDLYQLISDRVAIIDPVSVVENGAAACREKLGVNPEQVADYLGLVGDANDDIPGVPGVGPKTAAKLLERFTFLDTLYTHPISAVEEIVSKRIAGLVFEHRASALLSRDLARPQLKPVPWCEMAACTSPGGVSLRDIASAW